MKDESNTVIGQNGKQYDRLIAFDSINIPVCIINADGEIIYTNKHFNNNIYPTNIDADPVWNTIILPEYRERYSKTYQKIIDGSNSESCFTIIYLNDGQQQPAEVHFYRFFTEEGFPSVLICFSFVDNRLLSFDRSTLSTLSADNFQYDSLHFEFSPNPIIRIDTDLNIIKCSNSCESFLGYKVSERINDIPVKLDGLFGKDKEDVINTIKDIFSGKSSFQRLGEITIINKTSYRIVNLVVYPIVTDNQINAIEIIFEDITEQKDLKEKINSSNRAKLLSNITRGFLHSLNNTMNVILNKTQLLSKINEKKSVADGMQLIEESVNKIVEKARQVQNFITPPEQMDVQTIEPIVDIIEDSIDFFKMQFKSEDREKKRKIAVERKYFSNSQIQTDTQLLRELIISNIMRVSRFITENGTIEVTLQGEDNSTLSISTKKINNTEPSLQSPSVNIFSGVNIREVAEKLEMKIIEKESDNDYTLNIIIPGKLVQNKFVKKSVNLPYKIRDLDILLVEDDESLKTVLNEFFDNMGNRVMVCRDGLEALGEFEKKAYDIVITDYGIEEITGIELAAKIKEIDEKTPTVLLSGWMLSDISTYKNVVDLFIPKPFKLDELIQKISKLLNEKNQKT